MQDMNPNEPGALPNGEIDREGAMAKADLHKLASYSIKLFKEIDDEDQLESWVQAKITKAADYIASVYHYMHYEMKFSDYGEKLNDAEIYNESQKAEILAKLAEAKSKIAQLKEIQAEKIVNEGRAKSVEDTIDFGFNSVLEAKKIPTTWTDKSGKKHPATKVLGDKDSNKQEKEQDDKDDDKMDEVFDANAKPGEKKKTTHGVATKTATGLKHERKFKDEPKSKEDKQVDEELKGNQSKIDANNNGKIDADDFKKLRAGKKVKEGAKPDFLDFDKDGDKKEPMKKAIKDKKVKETTEEKCDECGMYESKCECNKMEESAPSAGLSKKQKSSIAKKASASKDIGKPGKSFDKVAKAAGGGEKGKKIAAAAMWKNAPRESMSEEVTDVVKAEQPYKDPKTGKMVTPPKGATQPAADSKFAPGDKRNMQAKEESLNESTEFNRMKEFLTRLNG